MGIVYLAHDPVIGREVAIKVLRTVDEGAMLERFKREIRIAGALTHPSIVRIYDAGEIDDQPFVAMEYVDGQTLDTLIKRATPLDLDRKLAMLIDLADGLTYAHQRQVVHRDIKPANLIVDGHERLKILDFGVARFVGVGHTSNWAIGTPGYMAPEQLRGRAADVKSDIFAAGVVAYELIAYRKPFAAATLAAVHHRILYEAPRSLTEVAPGVPEALEEVVFRCLEKDSGRRLATAAELGERLRDVREHLTEEETTLTAEPPPDEPGERPSAIPSTPRRGASSTARRVAELRRRALHDARQRAHDAFERADFVAAIDAAEQALVIDTNDPDMVALLEQAREAQDRASAIALLERARERTAADALDEARRLVDQACALHVSTPDVVAMETAVRQAIELAERRALDAARVAEHLQRAREWLERGAWRAAQQRVDAARLLVPTDVGVGVVQGMVDAARLAQEAEDAARLAAPRASAESARDPATLPTLPPRPPERTPGPATTPVTALPAPAALEPPPAAVAIAAGSDMVRSARDSGATWGRSLRLSDGPRLHNAGWTISAAVHAVLASLVLAAIASTSTIAQLPEPPVWLVTPVATTPPPPPPAPKKVAATPASGSTRRAPIDNAAPPVASPDPLPTSVPLEAPTQINPEIPFAPVDGPSPPAPPSPEASGGVSEQPVTDFDREPQLVARVKPRIPAGATGVVRVQVTIRSDGTVARVTVLDDTPYSSAVVEAAQQCRFRPALRRGRRVAVNQVLIFDLATDR